MVIVKVLGVYMIVSGLFLLFRSKTLPLLLKDFFEHPATLFLAGLVLIILGGILVFSKAQSIVVTVLGWIVLLKGAAYILAPQLFKKFTMRGFRPIHVVIALLTIALGYLLVTV